VHHIDKTIKEVRSFDKIGYEAFKLYLEKYHDKLMLLCSNCHRIEDYKLTLNS